jgi:ADP-ribosyl-[dinitrogen reductase] hydrolase
MIPAPAGGLTTLDRFRGCLLGLATGDAVGTTLEFKPRGSFEPLTDMLGGGPFNLAAGQWTDDTSMALCLATSLVECRGFDARDQMERYWHWYSEGYLSSTGTCFDIGSTTRSALSLFQRTGDPFAGSVESYSAGNGCIMRLAPAAMYAFPDNANAERLATYSSRTTHGAEECLDACRLLARMLVRALKGETKEAILLADRESFTGNANIVAIANGLYISKPEQEIRSSGYVVDCLEAAGWCFWQTGSYREAILRAANLGDDADTTAAVCGQLAGAYYGEPGIPVQWLEKLAYRDEISTLAERLMHGR